MSSRRVRFIALTGISAILSIFGCSACAPGYLLRAAYEQTGILLRREPIQEIIEDPSTDETTRRKLMLVLEARDYAKQIGLTPRNSFTKYSAVDRDVLLWVLSGSDKTSFTPYTWWFPIVGSVPYKGYFEKADGTNELERLKAKDYDVVLRGSPAFSTLGWFNDPLLSTTIRADEVGLVNTVIHETLHSTLWIPGQVSFNESLANFVGSIGSIQFFREHYPNSEWARTAEERWKDELLYADYFAEIQRRLEALYGNGQLSREQKLQDRELIFQQAKEEWLKRRQGLQSEHSRRSEMALNNAVIIGQRLYLDRLQLFENRYQQCGSSLPEFIRFLLRNADALRASKKDPYETIRDSSDQFEKPPILK